MTMIPIKINNLRVLLKRLPLPSPCRWECSVVGEIGGMSFSTKASSLDLHDCINMVKHKLQKKSERWKTIFDLLEKENHNADINMQYFYDNMRIWKTFFEFLTPLGDNYGI